MQRNILEYLERTVKKYPDKLAFANESMGMTFQEVSDVSGSIGTCLLKKGWALFSCFIINEYEVEGCRKVWYSVPGNGESACADKAFFCEQECCSNVR